MINAEYESEMLPLSEKLLDLILYVDSMKTLQFRRQQFYEVQIDWHRKVSRLVNDILSKQEARPIVFREGKQYFIRSSYINIERILNYIQTAKQREELMSLEVSEIEKKFSIYLDIQTRNNTRKRRS